MTRASEIIERYGELAEALSRMRQLARSGQWTGLVDLDVHCTRIVAQLRTLEPLAALEPDERARVATLIAGIRADQTEIAGLLRPEFARLARRMQELQRGRRARAAYAEA